MKAPLFANLSYRFKVPLLLMLVILMTGGLVTATLVGHSYNDLRRDLIDSTQRVGEVLASTLVPALKHDDLWRAYQIVSVPYRARSGSAELETFVVVLDRRLQVYVSSQPELFPTASSLPAEYRWLREEVERQLGPAGRVLDAREQDKILVVQPIFDGDERSRYGTLVIGVSPSALMPRFYAMLLRATLTSLLVLALLLPLGWYLGKRMIGPLTHLAGCLGQLGHVPPSAISCQVPIGRDEIGQLGSQFHHMLAELREKEALEQRIMMADRLAAVGRMSAGIAHEINNPLGGMLNAINTYKRYARGDEVTERTLSLLERGLLQIRETVSALLVEARLERRSLTMQDIDDIRTLVLSSIQAKEGVLCWENGLDGEVGLPSTLIRQLLINLLLNAIQAIPASGKVWCRVWIADGSLFADVRNDGPAIPSGLIDRLFEPFVQHGSTGSGLGLWVSYQIVQQLGGSIDVASRDGDTRFLVTIPLPVRNGGDARHGQALSD